MLQIADCLPGELVSILGKGFAYVPDAAGPAAKAALLDSATGATVPGELTLFVTPDQARDPALRRYLDQLDPRARSGIAVSVLETGTSAPVTDPATLRAVAAGLDLPVIVRESVAGLDVVPVDEAGQVTAAPPAGYLLLPPGAAAQRAALRDAVALPHLVPDIAAGFERLAGWANRSAAVATQLGTPPGAGVDPHPVAGPHTTTSALGIKVARYGVGSTKVFDVLTSAKPLTVGQLADALDGEFAPVRPTRLAALLRATPGSSALVTGTAPGSAVQQVFWLMSDADGDLTWRDPLARDPAAFDVDGGRDWRTAVLEGDDAGALLLGPDGVPVALPAEASLPPRAFTAINPPTHAIPMAEGPLGIGGLPPTTLERHGIDRLDLAGLPIIMIGVRETPARALAPRHRNALEGGLQRYNVHNIRPTVIAFDHHQEVQDLVTNPEYQGALLQWVPRGLGKPVWELRTPGDAPRSFPGPWLTQEMLDLANLAELDASRPLRPEPLPRLLIEQLSFNKYEEAAAHFQENGPELRKEAMVTAMHDYAGRFPGDRRLRAFDLVFQIAAQAPYLAGPEPVAPTVRTSLDPEGPWPVDRPVDLRFLFDYLTAAELDPTAAGGTRPGHYQTRLLWDGLLLQALLGRALTPDETVALAGGVGESDAERAARAPGAPETAQAHASIFESLKHILDPDEQNSDAWQSVLAVEDCLTGEDRVAWHFRIKDIVLKYVNDGGQLKPNPGAIRKITELQSILNVCH